MGSAPRRLSRGSGASASARSRGAPPSGRACTGGLPTAPSGRAVTACWPAACSDASASGRATATTITLSSPPPATPLLARYCSFAETDILVLCLPVTPETRGVIDSEALAALPRGAYLVNVARGPLVDYRALHAALKRGHLGGAALDVFGQEPTPPDDPLLALPNVVATPHVAGVTERSYQGIADAVAANIERLRHGAPPLYRVV
ncbi:MAG TPA: NAD(P)-dependent oxidoreductase [Chloroflexota bacterium]|nr:NAD(P)-dependent oxidoreductase [Chloroflexota bacterium]